MSLPKLMYPKFEITIPSSGKVIHYRPFLVKEEKLLLLAQQSGNINEVVNAIVQVINNCIVEEDFDVDELTTFDIEYFFVKLRANSVNSMIEITYRDPDDNKKYDVEINLNDVELLKDPNHSNKIKVNDDLTIMLKYPKPSMLEESKNLSTELDVFFVLLRSCLDCIYTDEKVFYFKDYSKEEIEEFISTLDVATFKKIQDFFETIPKLHYVMKYKNSNDEEKSVVLSSLTDFFMLG